MAMVTSTKTLSTKTLRKLSTTTAVVALTGGLLGVGTADAQERPEASSIDQLVQMSSNLFGLRRRTRAGPSAGESGT